MRLHQIDLNLLVVFETIYREQNLTRAAHKLHLTQPAISHALSRLRELFGDPLFTRVGRTMEPTPLSRDVIGAVRQALTTLERGLFPRAGFDAATSDRRFHIAVRDAFEIMWMPPLLQAVRRQAPNVQMVSVRAAQAAQLETELAAGTVDVALELPIALSGNVRSQELGQEGELCVVGRRGHPMFQRASSRSALNTKLTLEHYVSASHIIVSSRRRGPGLEDLALRGAGQRRRIVARCQSYLAACNAVAETDLLLTLPKRVLSAIADPKRYAVAKFPVTTPAIGVHMLWHTAADNDPANQWLRGIITSLAKKM